MATGAIYLTEASSGAPTLSGTNGTLCAVLDWALPQKGWTIEYTATNMRVYRPPSGNRFRLFVAHDSATTGDARLALLRGCESATAASLAGITDPFPTVAQVPNNQSTVLVSTTASAVARGYRIIVSPTFLVLATDCASATAASWDLAMFGDLAGTESADSYATICLVGESSSTTSITARGMGAVMGPNFSSGKVYFCRSIDATVKSSRGCLYGSSSTTAVTSFMNTGGAPAMRSGYAGRINREKVGATCIGSANTTVGGPAVMKRGWIPNVWNPLHSNLGGVTTADDFTDTAYASGSSFTFAAASSSVACILETSDTWSPPSG